MIHHKPQKAIDRTANPENTRISYSRRCKVHCCYDFTRESKPVCPQHVHLMPYPAMVIAHLNALAEEDKRVHHGGARACRETDHLRKEILDVITAMGTVSIPRLYRCLGSELGESATSLLVVEAYVSHLRRRKLVTLARNSRGILTVSVA